MTRPRPAPRHRGLWRHVLVVVGMILITPRGQVEVHVEGDDPQGSTLSPRSARLDRSAPDTANV